MKQTTPVWLAKKYANLMLDRLFPLKTVEVDGLKFRYLRRDPPPQIPTEFSARGHEFHNRIEGLSGFVAVDIGANIGSYALRLAPRFHNVIAFEPNPFHCKLLRLNLALNHLQNVHVEEVALSDVEAIMPLYIRQGGATSLDATHYGLKYDTTRNVRLARLDDFRAKLEHLDFVKLDAEHHEYQILKGGKEVIVRFKPIMAIEVHEPRVSSDSTCRCNTCDFVRSLGYGVEVTGEFSIVGPVHWVWARPLKEIE